MEFLLQNNADLNGADNKRRTYLSYVVEYEFEQVVKLLMQFGAKPSVNEAFISV